MHRTTYDYVVFSLLVHLLLLVSLATLPKLNTYRETIEVTVNTPRKTSKGQVGAILPYSRKPSISGRGTGSNKQHPKINLDDYAAQCKMALDSTWLEMYQNMQTHFSHVYTTFLLLSVDKYGRIIKVTVKTSSGNQLFDQLALDAVKAVGTLPTPPSELVTEGILWSFSNGSK